MQVSTYPSPPLLDFEIMDRCQQLPPITTQLPDYFPKQRPNTPPISPDDSRQNQLPSVKRKRSDPHFVAADDRSQQQQSAKRPLHEWRPSNDQSVVAPETPITSRSFGRSPPLRAVEPSLRRSPTSQQSYYDRVQSAISPQSGSTSAVTKMSTDSYARSQPSRTQSTLNSASTDSDANIAAQFHTQTRVLPPLLTAQSPRASNSKFDNLSSSTGKVSLPPLEPAPYAQASGSSTYPLYPAYGALSHSNSGRHSSISEISMSAQEARQSRAPSHPQLLHPAFEPKVERPHTFDPVRPQLTNPWRPSESLHRALPSMPGLTDPIPPLPSATSSHLTTSPNHPRTASHSLDRYRFDAPPSADHPARRRRGNLPKEATARLNEWFAMHATYPYPKEDEKQTLQEQTGLTMSQIGNWFINARRRRRPSATTRLVEPHPSAPGHYAPHDRPPYDYQRLPPYPR